MANISVTYSFSNGTTADASQVNTNFLDIINGTSDGTRDLSVANVTASTSLTCNGDTVLGNASGDTLTIIASLASSLIPNVDATIDLGTNNLGYRYLYLGDGDNETIRLGAPALVADYNITLPDAAPTTNYQVLQADTSGNASFKDRVNYHQHINLGLAGTVAASALTIALKGQDGSDPSATNPVQVVFRNATAATGTASVLNITSALSLVISSGSTLGHASGVDQYIYIYLINNGGTPLLGASSIIFDDGSLQTTTSEGGGGAADSNRVLYASSAVVSKPVTLIGRFKVNEVTAGTWATAPSEIALWPFEAQEIYAEYITNASTTTTTFNNNTATIIDYNLKVQDTHNAVVPGVAWAFTCPRAGIYEVECGYEFASDAWTVAQVTVLQLYINGVSVRSITVCRIQATTTFAPSLFGTTNRYCAAGDTIKIFGLQNQGGSNAGSTDGAINRVSIRYAGSRLS